MTLIKPDASREFKGWASPNALQPALLASKEVYYAKMMYLACTPNDDTTFVYEKIVPAHNLLQTENFMPAFKRFATELDPYNPAAIVSEKHPYVALLGETALSDILGDVGMLIEHVRCFYIDEPVPADRVSWKV
jgi:hypothetical protein